MEGGGQEIGECSVCKNGDECCVCFKPVCHNNPHGELCFECASKVDVHPAKQVPIKRCICGKPWNHTCAMDALFSIRGGAYYVDTSKLTNDSLKNRELTRNPDHLIPIAKGRHAPL